MFLFIDSHRSYVVAVIILMFIYSDSFSYWCISIIYLIGGKYFDRKNERHKAVRFINYIVLGQLFINVDFTYYLNLQAKTHGYIAWS